MAAVNVGSLKKMLSKQYKYKDATMREIISVITQYKDLKPVMDAYVFNDGTSRDLMNLTGTIPTGQHLDANGKIYLPYLHEWNHSDLYGLIQVMIVVFGEEPPVFSRPTTQTPIQAFQAAGPLITTKLNQNQNQMTAAPRASSRLLKQPQ
ncbi:hypothetical protein JZ751_029910 [Albula glossodonta]|uniref:UEV domain-containing protein n=1 Tax=Albula glossodonta TaxID=121402 RepID=A0A8T2NAL9_9TELE|nr:hypothetical protein JZ751_029910 [Albula glossodonta]